MGTGIGHLRSKYRAGVLANLPILAVASCALWANYAIAAPAGSPAGSLQVDTEVTRLLDGADKGLKAGNINLALIQLKNAVRLAPTNGEVRAHLGVTLLDSGQAVAAERELRQAQKDNAPYDMVVPALLRAMLRKNEIKELLAEFPDPPQGTQDTTTADILAARAIALQGSGRPKEARAAMDRSLGLRRDADGLVTSARLAQEQGDLALARSQTDETLKLSSTNEAALMSRVLLARQGGDAQKALADADEFVKRVPGMVAKFLRIEVLLDLEQDPRAKQEVDALLKETPNSVYGRYYRGVLLARAKDFKGAWQEMQNLPPRFVQSQPPIAKMVAGVAVASGKVELGGAILTTLVARHPDDRLARLQLAGLRLGQKAPQAALDALAPLKASDDPSVHALLAQAYLGLGRFDEAIPSLEIANSSPNANTLLLKRQLALSQLQVGETDQAIQGLRDLLQRDPGNAELAAALIAALRRASKWDEALAVADGMAKQAPTSPLPPFYRGQILIARGKLAEGASEFGKALALDPKFVPALYDRANLSVTRGNPEEAKKDLQLIVTQNPANMLAYIKLSEIALANGQDQEALAVLDRAIKAAPNDPTPRLALANYQVRQGKYQDAQVTVNGLRRVSNNPEGLALQGQIQLLRGQTKDAINTFRTLATDNTSSPGAYALLARALYASKDQFAAEEAAKKAIELAPNSAQMRTEIINIQIGADKGENALATARTYANANPGPDADLLLADTFLRLKRTNEAEALLDKSLSAKPDSRVVMRLSQIAMNSGNFKKSRAVLTNWIAKNPNDFAMRRQYAGLLMGSGDLAGARKEYEALLKQNPDDPILLNNLGWLLQKDDPDRALSLVSLAAKIAPQSAAIADTLGWMKYQRRDHQGALPLLQRAHNMNADSAPISYHFALVLDATGRRAEAKTLLQATLAKNPKFDGADDAKQLLARW